MTGHRDDVSLVVPSITRVKREDVDAMLALARADSASLATRRDLWAPDRLGLPHRRGEAERPASLWEVDQSAMPLSKRGK